MELRQPQTSFLIFAAGLSGLSAWLWWSLRSRNLPPRCGFWFLPLGETLSYARDPLGYIEAKLSRFGTCWASLLFTPTVFLAVTEANAKLFFSEKDMAWPAHFQKLVGPKSLLVVNDPFHKRIRTFNSRAFADKQLDLYLPCLQKTSAKHLQLWADGEIRDLHWQVKKYAFECGETVILGETHQTDRFLQLFDDTMKGLACIPPLDVPGFPFHKCMKSRRLLMQEFHTVLEKKRKKIKDPCRMFQISSMLDTLLQVEEMSSDGELLDFCIAMMFAGHDTSTCSIQSCLHWLKQCPEVEALLRQEVRASWDGECKITRQILDSIPQTRAFLQEVLRITPPAQVVMRSLREDTEVDGYVVPKGWTLVWAPAGVHSKAKDSETFSIHRHLQNGKFLDRTFDPTYFASFGGGSRMCIGYKFARDELMVFLLHFLYGFDVKLSHSNFHRFPLRFWRLQGAFHEVN